ncbi:MAG: DUF4167 domain-containing protein [Candidatus Pelagibacter sp.]|jgi:hypothetical protein|tara:strand:- start:1560 stop:1919 length:360 start_codon:yes stop_codon:yes gene_type:complete
MKNYKSNRRNRYRNNGSSYSRGNNGHKFDQSFSNNPEFQRKHVGKNSHSIQKLIEKYKDLGKEAISKGDKILSENYFQHADHFIRIINERNIENKDKDINSKDKSISTESTDPTIKISD